MIQLDPKRLPGGRSGKEVKNPSANARDTETVLISGSGRSPGGGDGNLLQSACLENPTDTGASRAAVHGVAKSWTRLSTHTLDMGVSTPTLTGHLTIVLHNRCFFPYTTVPPGQSIHEKPL